MGKLKDRDFIFTGLQIWDIPIGSNAIDIAREISGNNRVLYVNTPLDQMSVLRKGKNDISDSRIEVIRKKADPLRKLSDSLWVLDLPFSVWSVNSLPDGFIFDFFNRLNNSKIYSYVTSISEKLGFRNPIHFIDNDIYRSLYSKELLNPALSVYYRRDNLHPMYYWKNHAPRLEPHIILKSDLIVANSKELADYARNYNPRSYDVGQGVDLSAYNPGFSFIVPEELKAIKGPVIGYIGDINSTRLDADLISVVAESRPSYSFVLIGKEDNTFRKHRLHELPNVYFPGSISKSSVPEYLAAFDVCINPQLVNEITIGNYPRKVDEYLAMGKPVVATRTNTMELFREHVYLCSSAGDYEAAIDRALSENNSQKSSERIRFANSHSWEKNVERIYDRIIEVLK